MDFQSGSRFCEYSIRLFDDDGEVADSLLLLLLSSSDEITSASMIFVGDRSSLGALVLVRVVSAISAAGCHRLQEGDG